MAGESHVGTCWKCDGPVLGASVHNRCPEPEVESHPPKTSEMKTARQRAEEFLRFAQEGDLDGLIYMAGVLEDSFKQHAKDQRHLCAERVLLETPDARGVGEAARHAHQSALNTPAPGKQ